jgi:hypothetical protein
MSDPTVGPPPVPASPAVAEPPAYRPLSLLAVVGLGVAIIYAAVVVVGGAFAFFFGNPFLMPTIWVLVPIGAAVLCGMAMLRIQRSEGTLAGEKAARWGLLLSLLVGCGYWAYVAATYIAISNAAEKFGYEYLNKMASGDELGAFCLAMSPGERPSQNDRGRLREQMESRFNNASERGPKGPLALFRQTESIRMVTMGGKDTTIELVGVDSVEYKSGAYEVRLIYHVSEPAVSFNFVVTALGREAKGSAGRQWQVLLDQTGRRQGDDPQFTPEGRAFFFAGNGARDYLTQDWLKAMSEGRVEDVFLATLPPGEREAARKSAQDRSLALLLAASIGDGALPWADPAAALARLSLPADLAAARAASLPGFAGFTDGDLVRAEPGVFWAPPDVSDEIVKLTRAQFRHPGAALAAALTPDRNVLVPVIRREGDRLESGWDVGMAVPASKPRYFVEGHLVVECDAAEAAAGAVKSWRVRSLDLISGKPIPQGAPASPADRLAPGM